MPDSPEDFRFKRVEQELKARLQQQAAITQFGQKALETSDLNTLLQEACATAASTLSVDYSSIFELREQGELRLAAGAGWKDGAVGQVLGAGIDSQPGYTLLVREPINVPELENETRFAIDLLQREHGITSSITVVIPGKSLPFGVLGVHSARERQFNLEDIQFLQGVSHVLASAVERMRVEDALRTSRDQFEAILHGVADGVTVQDRAGQITFANQAAAELTGFPSSEALIQTPTGEIMQRFEILDETGQPMPYDRLPGRLALQGYDHPSATIRFRIRPTGEEHWSLTKSRPIRNAEGDVIMAVNIFQNVTELKRREQAQEFLAKAGELLVESLDYQTTLRQVASLAVPRLADWCVVSVVENETVIPIAVAHVDPKKVELAHELQQRYPTDWNAKTGLVNVLRTGVPEFYPVITDQMLQATARDEEHLRLARALNIKSAIFVPLNARNRTLGAITLVWAESGHTYTQQDIDLVQELANRAALAIDNARLYQEAQKLNSELEDRVSRRTNQLQDMVTQLNVEIVERKTAEKVLQSLFEAAPDAVILLDSQGKISRLNAQAIATFGYPAEELNGQSVEILLPYRFRKLRSFSLVELASRSDRANLELYGLRKDGSEFPMDVLLNPVHIDSGRLTIASIRDISRRKQMEAELSEVQRRLIESIEAERLHLAQELHDGPMQDLYGVFYQLDSLASEDEELQVPDVVRSDLKDLKVTVQQVNDLLRNVCGELRPPSLAPFGLEKAIRAHIMPIMEKHPNLIVNLDLEKDGQTLSERVRLALFRIYQHAFSNVIRHANASKVQIRLKLNGEHVTLEVEDDGCGFEMPARWIDLARNGHLGLIGTAERVQAIGGELHIRSSPGQGTLIQVTAPINEPVAGTFLPASPQLTTME